MLGNCNTRGESINKVPVEGLQLCVKETILQKLDAPESEHFSQPRTMVWEEQRYNTRKITLLDFVYDEPLFGFINFF